MREHVMTADMMRGMTIRDTMTTDTKIRVMMSHMTMHTAMQIMRIIIRGMNIMKKSTLKKTIMKTNTTKKRRKMKLTAMKENLR